MDHAKQDLPGARLMIYVLVYLLVCLSLGFACCCGLTNCNECCNEGAAFYDLQVDVSGVDNDSCVQCTDMNGSWSIIQVDFDSCLTFGDTWEGPSVCYGGGSGSMDSLASVVDDEHCKIEVTLTPIGWAGEYVFAAPTSCTSIIGAVLTPTSTPTPDGICDFSAIIVEITVS